MAGIPSFVEGTTMNHVIVGAGPAGVIASETLARMGHGGRVTVLSDEPEPPYSRMAFPISWPKTSTRKGRACAIRTVTTTVSASA